jgi:hypothetical protein
MDKKINEIESTFFLSFCGQKVHMTTNLMNNISTQDEHSNSIESIPITFEGILLDYDKDYYYLSNNAIEIDQAVRRTSVIHVGILEEKNIFDEILDSIPNPKDDSDVN